MLAQFFKRVSVVVTYLKFAVKDIQNKHLNHKCWVILQVSESLT